MKRFTALLLILTMFTGCLMTGCTPSDDNGRRRRDRDIEEEEEDEDDEDDERSDRNSLVRPADDAEPPLFETTPVEVTEEFEAITADPVDTPWVLENNIPFTNGSVNTYYNQFLTNGAMTQDLNGNVLNNVATISRPVVSHYPAETPGYTVYEISYAENFPTSVELTRTSDYNTTWFYHDVGFLDYYTGTVYPVVNLSGDINSFCIYGDVTYEGETYTVYYYSYRDYDVGTDEIVTGDNGEQIWEINETIYMTDYFIVPDGYDGIVMYVYIADDTYMTFDELIEQDYPYLNDHHVFGEPGSDEVIEDYAFLSIAELG